MNKANFIPFLALCFIFSSCSKECDEPDIGSINAFYFEMKSEGEDGFTEEQLESLYIVRFVPYSEPLIADTMYLNGRFPDGDGKFHINDEFPFLNIQSPYYPTFGYMVVEPETGFVGNIENLELKGEYDGDCNYRNIDKKFTFNGEEHNYGGEKRFFTITR